MEDKGTIWLVVNSNSGSYSEEAVADLQEAIAHSGREAGRIFDCQAEDLPDRAALETARVDLLAVFAGDGTLSAYLGNLEREGWGGTVLTLPGGTQNLLCKSIFGECDTSEIAAMLAGRELVETERTCLRLGDYTALADILLGPGARWADVREDLREGAIGEMLTKSVNIARDALDSAFARLVDPPVGREEGYPGLHFSISDGQMVARGYHMDDLAEWVAQGAAIVLRDFRKGPHEELGTMEQARCASTEGEKIEIMVDGERASATREVLVKVDRFGLKFLGMSAG